MYDQDLPLDVETANKVYDILVEHAGASDSENSRLAFTYAQCRQYLTEYRFIGSLGFGGKFRRGGHNQDLYVDCYSEDRSPARYEAIISTNMALRELSSDTYIPTPEAPATDGTGGTELL